MSYMQVEDLELATKYVYETGIVIKTPMLCNVGRLFDLPSNIELYLKLETMQATGKL